MQWDVGGIELSHADYLSDQVLEVNDHLKRNLHTLQNNQRLHAVCLPSLIKKTKTWWGKYLILAIIVHFLSISSLKDFTHKHTVTFLIWVILCHFSFEMIKSNHGISLVVLQIGSYFERKQHLIVTMKFFSVYLASISQERKCHPGILLWSLLRYL